MATMSDFFPSKYLKAADLNGKARTFVMDSVDVEQFENDGKQSVKPVLHFQGPSTKPLVLNKTNFIRIAAQHGEDVDHWHGKPVTLGVEFVEFRGKTSQAIRVQFNTIPVATNVIKPAVADEMNDAIPF